MEQKIKNLSEKANHIYTVMKLICFICSLIFAFCVYIFSTSENIKSNTASIISLDNKVSELIIDDNKRFESVDKRILENRETSIKNADKIEIEIGRVHDDLQLIKNELIKKGLK